MCDSERLYCVNLPGVETLNKRIHDKSIQIITTINSTTTTCKSGIGPYKDYMTAV